MNDPEGYGAEHVLLPENANKHATPIDTADKNLAREETRIAGFQDVIKTHMTLAMDVAANTSLRRV